MVNHHSHLLIPPPKEEDPELKNHLWFLSKPGASKGTFHTPGPRRRGRRQQRRHSEPSLLAETRLPLTTLPTGRKWASSVYWGACVLLTCPVHSPRRNHTGPVDSSSRLCSEGCCRSGRGGISDEAWLHNDRMLLPSKSHPSQATRGRICCSALVREKKAKGTSLDWAFFFFLSRNYISDKRSQHWNASVSHPLSSQMVMILDFPTTSPLAGAPGKHSATGFKSMNSGNTQICV